MPDYSLTEVRKIVDLPPSTITRLIAAGFVTPRRGARREYRFSFQDLVVLRAAKGLTDANLPARRISRSLRRLREQLPDQLPLAGLRIAAVGNSVVVTDGTAKWRADDGQYLLAFEVNAPGGKVAFVEPRRPSSLDTASRWFDEGRRLEESDVTRALEAYRQAVSEDACLSGAYVNLGCLLHEAGRFEEAAHVYERAIAACPNDAILYFNFAVLREDQRRSSDAVELYERAISVDPKMADAHYNLGLQYESLGRTRDAVRHLSTYRKLAAS